MGGVAGGAGAGAMTAPTASQTTAGLGVTPILYASRRARNAASNAA